MVTKNTALCFIILLVALAGQNCKHNHSLTSKQEMYKSIYIDEFKLAYFRQTLIKGYNNSKAIQEVISSDHSGFTELILTEGDYKLIDSLSTVANGKMILDSIAGNRRAEGAQGKRPLEFILNRLHSQWLDSLANKQYKSSSMDKVFDE